MPIRGIRGATQLVRDDRQEMSEAVVELVSEILDRNQLQIDQLVSALFTATPDLRSDFPASAARSLDLDEVPLICAQEIDVAGALPRVIRVLIHAEMASPRHEVVHVYLRGTEILRRDLGR